MDEDIRYMDANVTMGAGDWTYEGQPTSLEALLETMDHFGIHEALVRDSVGEIGDAAWANERILEKTANQPRLHPVWMLLPPYTRELPPPREMVSLMREHGVAAAWLNYGAFGLPLEDWVFGDMLEPLAEAGVPLFLSPIDARDGGRVDEMDWSGVVRVCRAFPNMPVVAVQARVYKGQRAMWAALAECPNLRVDMSMLWLHRSIEFLCREFGAERIIFGSQLPRRTPGAPLMQLNYSLIREEELARIAGGNMREMISWNKNVKPPAEDVVLPEPHDALHRAARERADISGEQFHDCHGHVGHANQRHVCVEGLDELVEDMDRLGVRQCCVFSWLGQGDMGLGNDIAAEAVHRFPDRFIGFTWINPNHGMDAAQRELDRGLENGMRGIKLLSGILNPRYDHEVVELACRFAHEHKQLILNHSWGPADNMRVWLEKYPDACYIAGHSAGNFAELVKEFPNIYICTCPFLTWGQTEQYVEMYGADRLLFGSDLQDLPIAWGMGPIFYAKISESNKRKILGENLKGLLESYSLPAAAR